MRRKSTLTLLVGIATLALLTPATARADYRQEKTLNLAPGGSFVLQADVGSVTITGTSESGAHVVITSNRDDIASLFDFSFDSSGGTAHVTARKKQHWGGWHNLSLHFDVQVPTDTGVEVKTGGGSVEISHLTRDANLDTSGGPIRVSDLAAALQAHTSGGSIELRQMKGAAHVETSGGGIEADSLGSTLEARTSGGSIHLEGVRGDLLAHTSGGSIRIEDAGGRVDAKTSGGSVEVSFAAGNARGGDVETSGGGVRVAVDRSIGLNIDASASSGSVSTDLPIQVVGTISRSHLQGTLGSGGQSLRLHSDGGPVHLEAR
ncbi:MAG TPA: DUF4097 family beta strand repeat-containing protein [Terriglobia bacterium]|nr:DUF4097 family beta strand repeat-containing protein [Terriglobia bacterium]